MFLWYSLTKNCSINGRVEMVKWSEHCCLRIVKKAAPPTHLLIKEWFVNYISFLKGKTAFSTLTGNNVSVTPARIPSNFRSSSVIHQSVSVSRSYQLATHVSHPVCCCPYCHIIHHTHLHHWTPTVDGTSLVCVWRRDRVCICVCPEWSAFISTTAGLSCHETLHCRSVG